MVSEQGFIGRDLISNSAFIDPTFAFSFWSDRKISRGYSFSFYNVVFCCPLFLQFGISFSFNFHSGFLCLFIMAAKRDDSFQYVSVRLDEKNYSYWSYVMGNFLKGKMMWGYVSGTSVKPRNTDESYVALIDV